MQKPDESLDIVKPAREVDSEPPREVRPEITGEAEVADNEVSTPVVNTFLSWLRRSLAVGSVLAIIILVLLSVLSAIFIGIDRPTPQSDVTTTVRPAPRSDVTTNARPADELTQTEEEPLSFD